MASEATYSCADVFSQEDLSLLAKSLKDEKFRALFSEYAKEVCEPENQKQFERELKQLEKERGVEAVFVHPSPGFALAVGGQKSGPVFVNICSSDVVQKPSFTRVDDGVNKGENWSWPHALPKPRRELLSKKVRLLRGDDSKAVNDVGRQAVVHDVVFHPDALQLASGSHLMKHTLIQTAMDSLCKNFQIKAEQPEEIETSVKYIGKPMQSVIKRVVDKKLFEASEQMSFHQDERTKVLENEIKNINEESTNSVMKEEVAGPLKPQYKVKHVSKMDLQDFSVQLIPQCGPAWRPHTLEVEVELPGVTRASQVDANVWPQSIVLSTDSTPQYKLELPLPYPVDEDLSAAKFDVSTQKLTLTLSVIPANKKNQGTVHDHSPSSDSGIECEPDYRTNSDGDNSSEVSLSSQEESLKGIDATEEEEDNVFEPTPSKSRVTLIPSYTVKQTKESLCVVLNCGNVLPSSVVAKLVDDHSARVELSSIGGGHTMLHYGLTVVCSPLQIAKSGVTSKVQDSIVEVTIKKAVSGQWETCQIGDGDRLTTVVLTSSSALDTEAKSSKKSMKSSKEPKCEVQV
ncbi:kintoun-like [Homarus americanus]|uniref:Kintoun-like n=1 Tax=Homarus americanus TaxID=6706 RepID=A0A8J5K3C0_HOMAM|nr:kintoun-like [Homarus americanus]